MSVTDSFLELDDTIRECQNVETFNDCETRLFIEKMLRECGCLPLSHILSEQVYKYYNKGSLQKDNDPLWHPEGLVKFSSFSPKPSLCTMPYCL